MYSASIQIQQIGMKTLNGYWHEVCMTCILDVYFSCYSSPNKNLRG
ncbi:hypothetical protein RchiOBHm_Chr1g0383791 [Rosa chinensis]|uniref:Uncharacterized protein n=1 Tax=Rosa chinensis TaxID=74649 RepID=A0A2P6SPR6_ROSCH|nr:hypothetical protein RchiOBHm_Chr1g0383791 [Rosa chinensis]